MIELNFLAGGPTKYKTRDGSVVMIIDKTDFNNKIRWYGRNLSKNNTKVTYDSKGNAIKPSNRELDLIHALNSFKETKDE